MTEPQTRILVVDDDPALLNLLVEALTKFGYEVATASDGIDALALLKDENLPDFNLVVTDIRMPKLDGIGLLKKIRRYCSDLPVLFITGVASAEMVAELSHDGFLTKPFSIFRLQEHIENALVLRKSWLEPTVSRKVLVNLQEDKFRVTLSEALGNCDYLPFSASDTDEALKQLEHGEFDLMISGIEKSVRDSQKAVGYIQTKYPALPTVIVSSSYSDEDISHFYGQLRIDGFMHRPFKIGELVNLLDRALGSHPNTDSLTSA